MKEHPMLYSTPMIRAKLEGRKTQTRRIVKSLLKDLNTEHNLTGVDILNDRLSAFFDRRIMAQCPYGKVGDVLWSREAWSISHYEGIDKHPTYLYRADMEGVKGIWKPSIHQPKVAARIWERITNIRVERLQDISPHDAGEEGVEYWNIDYEALQGGELVADYMNYTWRDDPDYEDYHFPTFGNPIDSYRTLWESINGEGSWNVNPWVWAITTEILSTTGRPKELSDELILNTPER